MVIPAAVAERLQSIVETFCQLHGVWSCFWKQHETFVLEKRAGVVGNAAGFLRVKFTTQNVIAHVDLFGERIDAVEQEPAEIQHGTGDPFNAKQIILYRLVESRTVTVANAATVPPEGVNQCMFDNAYLVCLDC